MIADASQPDQSKNAPESGENHKQSVIPDFAAMSAVETRPTAGAQPPDLAAPIETPKKGRGRPPKAKTPDIAAPNLQGEMVVTLLDTVLIIASDAEFKGDPSTRAALAESWEKYIQLSGGSIPPWAECSLLTLLYVAPALRSPTLTERVGFAFGRVKKWLTF